MQNKGFVKVFALLLTLVCVFYLSFSFVTTYQMNKVDEITKTQGEEAGAHYLDSVMNNPVWLGAYSLKDCREMEISLGLDLKGGMNVILEVSVPEVVKALADHKEDPAFNKAVAKAAEGAKNSQSDFITLFVKEYKTLAPDGNLAELFATQQLKGKVTTKIKCYVPKCSLPLTILIMCSVRVSTVSVWYSPISRRWKDRWGALWWRCRV